jgi:hypothetical protein
MFGASCDDQESPDPFDNAMFFWATLLEVIGFRPDMNSVSGDLTDDCEEGKSLSERPTRGGDQRKEEQ